jgi:hypothetical protein
MRSQDEIVARIKIRRDGDPLEFEISEYIDFLDFAHAQPYLKPATTPEDWTGAGRPLTDVRDVMIKYMPFAWQKANGCRGISAMRSLAHYTAWLWLDGAPDEMVEGLADYQHYGKSNLIAICQYLGLDPARWDDGVRVNSDWKRRGG